ncbi:hypothetical protein F1C16_20410 (plasmid) [Hymenobacter sp. NBH84]|uniref:hypothetical protein n=1 Tax=Hymenobacter sp. NBH84 TaxID=2596915 RepID=UPI001625CCBE|nr:hypothetical protein [Hymenobacter sp. NBH84]QNE41991.1 hypothetical protein F1C16_20410 [Hymenobacter sp. NBH84]
MELLSPERIVLTNRFIKATSEYSYTYQDSVHGIAKYGTIPTIFFNTEEWKPGTEGTVQVAHFAPSPEKIEKYVLFQELINTCINNAEDIKNKLHTAVGYILHKSSGSNKLVGSYDFMKLKDIFVEHLKKDNATRHLANKTLRRNFNQFILDRNIYTHGKLNIRYNDKQFVITYLDNHTKIESLAVVTKEIIQSYYRFYTVLRKLIADFHNIKNKKI